MDSADGDVFGRGVAVASSPPRARRFLDAREQQELAYLLACVWNCYRYVSGRGASEILLYVTTNDTTLLGRCPRTYYPYFHSDKEEKEVK
ncbi:Lysosomal-associated transmembrane protein 4B [Liparis tanakae]|uniref:Lysosomal-associated transmembrane protein 4B n=1 Tax=Liparis tanakae TaxID=230148 RepID=A0A4Z2EHS5_9TELE|nr:Lysosomal-associated transmembrane protein 4B [Liparis tanakae]